MSSFSVYPVFIEKGDIDTMQEIEIKAKYTNCSQKELEEYLTAHHYVRHHRIIQEDLYYNHPTRNFRITDEALRIRTEGQEDGSSTCCITYKGANRSHTGQNRSEIETTIADSVKACQILEALGFTPVARVHKDRTEFRKNNITICLDTLDGLGTYIEIEKLISDALTNEPETNSTEMELLQILHEIDFIHPQIETATYLELVLKQV